MGREARAWPYVGSQLASTTIFVDEVRDSLPGEGNSPAPILFSFFFLGTRFITEWIGKSRGLIAGWSGGGRAWMQDFACTAATRPSFGLIREIYFLNLVMGAICIHHGANTPEIVYAGGSICAATGANTPI
jgi:hypothetical protein